MIFFSHRFVASFNFWWGIPRFSIFEKKSDFVSISRTRKRNWPITDRSGHNLKMDFHSVFCTGRNTEGTVLLPYPSELSFYQHSALDTKEAIHWGKLWLISDYWQSPTTIILTVWATETKKFPPLFLVHQLSPKLLRGGKICEKNIKNSTLNYIIDV